MVVNEKKQDIFSEFRFHDDADPEANKKRKMPSRISAYEVHRTSHFHS
jgi:transcription elongation factor SPT6